MIKKILHCLFIITIGLLFMASAIHSAALPQGTILTKYLYFNLIGGVFCFILGLFFILFPSAGKLYFNILDGFLAIYLSYILIHFFFSSTVLDYRIVAQILLLFIYFPLKQYFIKINNTIYEKVILFMFLISGLYQGMLGTCQWLGWLPGLNSFFKVTGSFHNPGPYAIFFASYIPFALAIYFFQVNKADKLRKLIKLISLLFIIFALFVLPAAFSRTSWIALLLGILLVWVIKTGFVTKLLYLKNKKRNFFIFLFMGCVLLFSSIYLLYIIKKDSAFGRLLVWKVGVGMLKQKPIFGWGANGFEIEYNNFQARYFYHHFDPQEVKVAGKVKYAFNDFLQITIEYGIVGLILFLLIIYSVFNKKTLIYMVNSPKYLLVASVSGIVSILAACLFSYPLEVMPIYLNLIFFLAIFSSHSQNKVFYFNFNKMRLTLGSMLLFWGTFLIYSSRKDFGEYKKCFQAEELLQKGDYNSCIVLFKQLYPFIKYKGTFLLSYGKALALVGDDVSSIKILNQAKLTISDPFLYSNQGMSYTRLKNYSQAERCYKTAMCMIPNRLFPRYLLAKMYLEKGDTLSAKHMAKEIINTNEKVVSEASLEMKEEMNELLEEGEFKQAIKK